MSVEATNQAQPGAASTRDGVAQPSRRTLLTMGAVAGAATLALGASPGQADILRSLRGLLYLSPLVVNFAFEMEDLERQFFERAVRSDAFADLSPREQSVFALIAKEDGEHYKALKDYRDRNGLKGGGHFETPNASTGGSRVGVFNFPKNAFSTRKGLFDTALDIKETSLFAYHGAVDLVAKDALMLAAAVAGVEGRHLAILREINGLDPVPSPFEGNLQSGKAGRRLARYGFNGGSYGTGAMGGNRI